MGKRTSGGMMQLVDDVLEKENRIDLKKATEDMSVWRTRGCHKLPNEQTTEDR